ncbi:MAG: sigma 54-interacting transcriptional regulator [Deltaproteobacteria bacterium]|nr:sigma 54-interacting transcriptional regulator [Deltaproteobacteria bacterium]
MQSNLLDYSPIPQFVLGPDHRVIRWNHACEALTGYKAGDMIGTDFQWRPFYESKRPVLADLVLDGDYEGFLDLYGLKSGSESELLPHAWEARDFFSNLGGRPRHVSLLAAPVRDVEGHSIGALETIQDITVQVQFESDLMQSERRYRILAEHVADGVTVVQGRRMVFVNQAFATLLGYEAPAELMEKDAEGLICPEFRDQFRKTLRILEGGISLRVQWSWPCKTRKGNEVWLETYQNGFEWDGGPAVLITTRDITERMVQERALQAETEHLKNENRRLRSSIQERYRFGEIIGKSQPMQEVYERILQSASTDAGVIIHGESGTGKELVAQAIHNESARRGRPFMPVNCGGIPVTLMESEFFGYRRGAFTGAHADKQGYFDLANGGTLFLDEVAELDPAMQAKLLRAIETRAYMPVGGRELKKSDFRIIAATHKDLPQLLEMGIMREDFFYRIHIIPISVPPLRERKEDIPLLVEHFLRSLGRDGAALRIPSRVLDRLMEHDWPGNVRELQNVLQRYLTVREVHFPAGSGSPSRRPEFPDRASGQDTDGELRTSIDGYEKSLIMKALQKNHWHKAKAATSLGISRRTLFRKLRQLELA